MWQRVNAGTRRLQRFSKFPRFTAWCSGAFLQLLRNQNFNRLSCRCTPVTSANELSVLRICDLPTCRPEVARPVNTSAFVSTDLKDVLATSGLYASFC